VHPEVNYWIVADTAHRHEIADEEHVGIVESVVLSILARISDFDRGYFAQYDIVLTVFVVGFAAVFYLFQCAVLRSIQFWI